MDFEKTRRRNSKKNAGFWVLLYTGMACVTDKVREATGWRGMNVYRDDHGTVTVSSKS